VPQTRKGIRDFRAACKPIFQEAANQAGFPERMGRSNARPMRRSIVHRHTPSIGLSALDIPVIACSWGLAPGWYQAGPLALND
jgi:hypothetical protein